MVFKTALTFLTNTRLLTHTESLKGCYTVEICGVLKRVLRGVGESYLGLSKVVVVSSIAEDINTNGGV